eukprot:g3447.t1
MGNTISLASPEGLIPLNYKEVYALANKEKTVKVLEQLCGLADYHSLDTLINVGVVPIESRFIDVNPQVWVKHFRTLPATFETLSPRSREACTALIRGLLHKGLRRYGSMTFTGGVMGMDRGHRQRSFQRRLALLEGLYRCPHFPRSSMVHVWHKCALNAPRDDHKLLVWLCVAGADLTKTSPRTEARDEHRIGPVYEHSEAKLGFAPVVYVSPEVYGAILSAHPIIEEGMRALVTALCAQQGPRMPRALALLIVEYIGVPGYFPWEYQRGRLAQLGRLAAASWSSFSRWLET